MITNQITNEVRLRQWAEIIRERQTSGMNIKEWCEVRGISRYQYFYWQKKLRKMACETIAEKHQAGLIASDFTQVKLMETSIHHDMNDSTLSGHVRITINEVCIDADNGYPIKQLKELSQELRKPC